MTQALPPLGGAPPAGGQRGVLAAIAAIAIFGIATGMTHPLFALRLEAEGYSSGMIGLNAAMVAVASLTLAPFMPPAIRLLGLPLFLALGAAAAAASLLAFPAFDGFWAWLGLRYALGAAATALFVGSEAWIVAAAEPGARGRVVGLYATVLSIGFAAGPLILTGVGVDGWAPFVVCAVIALASLAPILSAWREAPRLDPDETSETAPLRFFVTAPTVFWAVALFGAIEFGVMGLLPVWGVRTGLDATAASVLVTALVLGNVVFQIPLGALAEGANRRAMLIFFALISVAAAVALPLLAGGGWRLWLMLFVWGGLCAGLYTVALIELGARYRGATLIAANAAVVTAYGVGALVGPLFSGVAMDVIDPHGVAVALGVMALAYLAMALRRAMRRRGGG